MLSRESSYYDRLLIMPVEETDPPPCFEPLDGMEQVRRTSLTQLRTALADVHFPLGVDGLVSWDGGQGERMLAASDEFGSAGPLFTAAAAEMGHRTVMDSLNECDVVLVWYDVPAPATAFEALLNPFEQGKVAAAATQYEIVLYSTIILLVCQEGKATCDFEQWLDELVAANAAGASRTNSMVQRLIKLFDFGVLSVE